MRRTDKRKWRIRTDRRRSVKRKRTERRIEWIEEEKGEEETILEEKENEERIEALERIEGEKEEKPIKEDETKNKM